jgi:hypothetical protein
MIQRFVAAVAVAALLAAGDVSAQEAVKVKPPQNKVLSAEDGRFVFGQISEYRRDQYLLDTRTGRLWRVVTTKNPDGTEGPDVLEPVAYVTLEGIRYQDPH